MVAGSPIIDFIESLWGEDPLNGYLTIGFYKNGKPYRYKFLRNLDHFDIKEIMTLNKEKFDIYYEIGLQKEVITEKGRRGSEKNVISIPGLWCNVDFIRDANKKENLANGCKFGIESY